MMNQNQDRYLQKIKNISGILALIIGVITFSIWYKIALSSYPNVPVHVERIQYYGSWIALSLAFLGLTLNAKNKIKQLVYYGGFNFYLFLVITYIINQLFDVLIRQNKIVLTLILTSLSCIIYYLMSYSEK